MSDFRLAFRNAFAHPAHTALVVIALALGLGLNAAVFSMGDALLLRPLQFPDVDRLVVIGHYRPGDLDNLNSNATPAGFLDWKRSGAPFDRMAAWGDWSANLTGGDQPERVQASRVSHELLEMLGVQIPIGRGFSGDDATLGNQHVVILSDGLWRRRFGGNPSIVGTPVHIEGRAYTVIGVAPSRFSFPQGSEIWVPLVFDAEEAAIRNQRYLTVVARLNEGATLEEARAHIAVVAANLKQQYPAAIGTLETAVQPVAQGLGDPGAANLIVVWQISAALVLLFAWWMLRVLKNAMPARIADFIIGWNEIDVDGRVLLFTAAGAAITTLVFGLLPAMQASSLRMVDTLKQGGRGATAGRLRLRRVLVTAEIALALPLLVAAGMTSLGTWRFVNGPQGYEPQGVLAFKTALPERSYPGLAERARFAEQVVERLEEIPGVTHAGATNVNPSSNSGWSTRYEIEGDPPPPTPDDRPVADYRTVTPGYFDAMRLPLTRGRGFSTADARDSLPVAIVSESFIARHWPGQDPIGRRLVFSGRERVVATIVGVTGDHIHDWFSSRERPTIFRPASQAATATLAFAVRTAGDPAAFAAAARSAVARVDPNQPIYQVMRQADQVRERAIGPRYAAGMMGLFGLIALLLSVIGIYALVRYYVAQRRQEIGVRMALGAGARDVVRMTVRQAAVMAAVGIAIGGVAAYAVSRLLEANLMGMAQNDPRLLAGFSAVLGIAALAAAYLPARRAAAIDPMVAMRGE